MAHRHNGQHFSHRARSLRFLSVLSWFHVMFSPYVRGGPAQPMAALARKPHGPQRHRIGLVLGIWPLTAVKSPALRKNGPVVNAPPHDRGDVRPLAHKRDEAANPALLALVDPHRHVGGFQGVVYGAG